MKENICTCSILQPQLTSLFPPVLFSLMFFPTQQPIYIYFILKKTKIKQNENHTLFQMHARTLSHPPQQRPFTEVTSSKEKKEENKKKDKKFGPTQIRTEIKRSRVSYTNPYTMGPVNNSLFGKCLQTEQALWL